MSPSAIALRPREASALTDLSAARRLDAKLDMGPAAIGARLREAAALHRLCAKLSGYGSRKQ